MARASLLQGGESDDDAMMKLLQTSALTALTLLFAACDPGMVDGDLEDRELQGDLWLADHEEEDDDDLALDDLADGADEPAPAMEDYDFDLGVGDSGGCDTAGDDDGVFASSPNHQGALDEDRDLADADDEGEDGWGPDHLGDVDDAGDPDVWHRPLGDGDGDDGWGPEALGDRPGAPDEDDWGPGDLDDVDDGDGDGEPQVDANGTIRDNLEDDDDDEDIDDIGTP